ncbi:MAG: nitrous oxide reductase accessory protein NosL [Bacteroidia bacterium]|nr:nitrous oxide reductase accessory protein NosL [Bacteroidia bacterium]
MKTNKIKGWIGAMLVLGGLLLIAVLYVPMWYIDLDAPQYPEGLQLLIFPDKIGGNVEIINGLNHYIGMKTLHTEDFIEFKLLPYIIMFFAVFFIIVGLLRHRKLMWLLLVLFVSFGIIAMVDFWRWEYNYGHNLDPNAAIIVPGMAYQPPLIGFKQLLNFGAYSMPDIGGWLFIASGALLLFGVIIDRRIMKKENKLNISAAVFILGLTLVSCSAEKEPIVIGKDNCDYCKMTISDARFGAEIVTKKGKVFKYDEAQCLLSDIKDGAVKSEDVKDIYLTDFCQNHELINHKNALFLKSEEFKSPMGGNVAAFSQRDSMVHYKKSINAEEVNWSNISK